MVHGAHLLRVMLHRGMDVWMHGGMTHGVMWWWCMGGMYVCMYVCMYV